MVCPCVLPMRTVELVLAASAQLRLGSAMAGSVTVTSFDSRIYGETSVQLFRGRLSGLVGAGVGSDGTYSALVSANLQLPRVNFYLSARTIDVPDNKIGRAS